MNIGFNAIQRNYSASKEQRKQVGFGLVKFSNNANDFYQFGVLVSCVPDRHLINTCLEYLTDKKNIVYQEIRRQFAKEVKQELQEGKLSKRHHSKDEIVSRINRISERRIARTLSRKVHKTLEDLQQQFDKLLGSSHNVHVRTINTCHNLDSITAEATPKAIRIALEAPEEQVSHSGKPYKKIDGQLSIPQIDTGAIAIKLKNADEKDASAIDAVDIPIQEFLQDMSGSAIKAVKELITVKRKAEEARRLTRVYRPGTLEFHF